MANEHVFKIILQPDYTYKIELGGYETLVALDKMSELAKTQKQMGNWMDSEAVPAQGKEQYRPMYLNLLSTMNDLWQLLIKAGVTKQDLLEHMEIPF